MTDLFPAKGDFKVARLSTADARLSTDHLKNLRELVLESQPMYPNIAKWFDDKVVSGIRDGERVAYVGYLDDHPVVSSVVKKGEHAKFCHLRIKENLQHMNLGEVFFALMGLEVRKFAKEIHFTLPENVWVKDNGFFTSFGFSRPVKAGHQYRLFEDELRCSSSFTRVWASILTKLPKIARVFSINGQSLDNRILMSIKAESAAKVLSGHKRVEIRRRFSRKWSGCRITIYASYPKSSLVGEALVSKVIADTPKNIWERFNTDIGCTRQEFEGYTQSSHEIYAIVLDNPIPYEKSIPVRQVADLTKNRLRPPQSYCNLSNNQKWAEAVSVSVLMQLAFGTPDPVVL